MNYYLGLYCVQCSFLNITAGKCHCKARESSLEGEKEGEPNSVLIRSTNTLWFSFQNLKLYLL